MGKWLLPGIAFAILLLFSGCVNQPEVCSSTDLTQCDGKTVTLTGKLEGTKYGLQVINGVMLGEQFGQEYLEKTVEVRGLLDLYYGKRLCDAGEPNGSIEQCWGGGPEFEGSGPRLTNIEYIKILE